MAAPAALPAVVAGALLAAPALASADTSSTLTLAGTSDISDSGLVANLIQPDLTAQYPQFTFKYVGSATGAAIGSAESATGGPSALIVDAASLENQFVAGGYSYENQYGSAIFTNDFVLAGPERDPAGVSSNGAHNVAQAFADIAAAGNEGKATFYTRGGATNASSATVEEHRIWELVHVSGLQPASLSLCDVSSADGGGMSPAIGAFNGRLCPDSGTVLGTHVPSWYFVESNADVTEAQSLIAADACTTASSGGANSCYALTDRGTFDYLTAGQSAAATGPSAIAGLRILTHDDSFFAPGGADELIDYLHVYIINPDKPGETVNLPAAQDLVSLLTSPAFQAQVKTYLPTADAFGPPFTGDASPTITHSSIPSPYRAGKPVTVTGTVTNGEPGYPPPARTTVTIDELVAGERIPVASGATGPTGAYGIKFAPTANGSFAIFTGSIPQIENGALDPLFGDLLSPASTAPIPVAVQSAVTSVAARPFGGRALVTGSVAPASGHLSALVAVLARPKRSKKHFKAVATERLAAGEGNFAVLVPLAARSWQLEAKFSDPKRVLGSTSPTLSISVGAAPAARVKLLSLKIIDGSLLVGGTVKPAAPRGGAAVELLALDTTAGAPASLRDLAMAKVATGKAHFTLDAELGRPARWALALEYLCPGRLPAVSRLRVIAA